MQTSSLISRRALLAIAAAGALPGARAQGSDGPIRLVVPFTPGTGIDLIARQIGPQLSRRLGRPVVVDNKAGASGNIGTQEVVRAAPDGSTLLVTVNTMVMNRALYPNAGFDPVKELDPVTLTSWGQLLLVASTKSGITSARDLVNRAKAKPGALNYGSPGAGTPHHLAMELVKNQTGTFITHVPYRGTAPAVTDLLGGTIDVMFLPIHVALQHVKAGSLRALGISSDKPHPLLMDVPPLKTLKLGDLEVEMWYGVLAPKGTPRAFVDRLNAQLKEILALPEVRAAFETQGMVPAHSTPEEFGALIRKDADRWSQLIQKQKITAE
ncbi:tripartite tricarboxylate transporter substrate binding protein [Piscinibacter koreensis]|uniref:Tripartite tricarboxylate transporter substrate binding protein n=1 Tax=Piscinibacter koreensis TaxID=2742824 RepID=A0A7Y6TV81_9BURK|nr:tripartite tricarboxylate transporter substrate binding protein [Schlegelella koreensis]NUZ04652.1 tripartite tricarboxylate transporter substrate binding protein [Schlegelella koreensis]